MFSDPDGEWLDDNKIIKYCGHCDEEYDVPEDLEWCPVCDSHLKEIV